MPASAFVAALPDSGFFLDWFGSIPMDNVRSYGSQIRANFKVFNASAGLDNDCIEAQISNESDPARCYFAQYAVPFIKIPIFAAHSIFDYWQLLHILGNDSVGPVVDRFSQIFVDTLGSTLFQNEYTHSGFIDSCHHHCGGSELSIDGTRMVDAFHDWYGHQRTAWIQRSQPPLVPPWQDIKPYLCKDCCNWDSTPTEPTWWQRWLKWLTGGARRLGVHAVSREVSLGPLVVV